MKHCLIFLVMLVARSAFAADHAIAVDSVAVKLFYQYSGKLSPPLSPSDSLVNVFIGEYSLERDRDAEPANIAIVDVTVSLPPGEDAFGSVDLVVTDMDAKKVVLRQAHETGKFSKAGISHVAFLYHEISCVKLQFEASVTTAGFKGRSKSKRITLPFDCHTGQ